LLLVIFDDDTNLFQFLSKFQLKLLLYNQCQINWFWSSRI